MQRKEGREEVRCFLKMLGRLYNNVRISGRDPLCSPKEGTMVDEWVAHRLSQYFKN